MQYRPGPSYIPPERDFGSSLDSIFNQYIQMKSQQDATKRQDFQDTVSFGAPIRQLSSQQLQRAAQPAPQIPGMIADPALGQPGANGMVEVPDNDPHVNAIRAFLERKRQGAAMEQRGQALDMSLKESQIAENNAQAQKALRTPMAGGLEPDKKAQIEGQIMDDYMKSPTFSNFAAAKSSLRDLASIQANKSGAGDIAAIYSFIKTMDPNAVKEGEVSMTQSALPGLDRVKVIYDSMKSGNKITPQMKRELLTVARGMYDAKLKSADEFRTPFVRRAQQYQIDPEIAVPSFAIPEAEMNQMFGTQADAPSGSLQQQAAAILAARRANARQPGR